MTAAPAVPHALDTALEATLARYAGRNPASRERADRAARSLPGGNTRTVLHFDPFPLAFARGEGAHLWSLDGDRYADLLGEYTAGLFGHSHPAILAAVREALDAGLNLGATTDVEHRLAEVLCARFDALERVRFTNSGTEANLMALALALHCTGRHEVLAFRGAYHGGVLAFGSGAPSAVTVPHAFVMGDHDDVAGTRALVRRHARTLGAVIVEPMLGSGGCIPASDDFLVMLREETAAAGALLILDEVMTSRLGPAGAGALAGVTPDLMTLGKYVAGGMSFGAFGGRAELMERYDPRRPGALAHAGTFNNNLLSMHAGIAGAGILTDEALAGLNARGDGLRDALNGVAAAAGAAVHVSGRGSLMTIHPGPRAYNAAEPADPRRDALRRLLFFELLDAGHWIAARGMLALSLQVTDAMCEAFVADFEAILRRHGALVC